MSQIRSLIFLAAVAAFAFLSGGQATAAEAAMNTLAAGGEAARSLLAGPAAEGVLLVKKRGHSYRRGGGRKSFGSHRVRRAPKFYGRRKFSKKYRRGWSKVRKHRRRHHRRSRRGGGIWWAAPLIAGPYLYDDYYEPDYDSCYWNCRRYHGPRYCRKRWRRYCY